MLESAAEGSGSRGIVVQGLCLHNLWSEMKRDGNHHQGGLSSRNLSRAHGDFVREGVAGIQESCSLRVLYKPAGVLLPRLNIAPSPIVNK